ncbi:MAG: D-sedoheptulose 7-phosphate isomerase [Candidatus Omnitrophota bacterium]|nr:D-sedoheptulose 7-phosphate isomerase [Candidatus Omnitrophota bacterium]
MEKIIKTSIENHKKALEFLETNRSKIEEIASLFVSTLKNKGKIIFMGNGGSAADAQHLAAELVGRFKKNRPALAAIAFSTNTSILTAIGNDFGFDEIFVRQIESLANPRDLAIGISTSGDSENIIKAIKKAKELGLKTVGFLGKNGGKLNSIVDFSLLIPSSDTPRIQEMHIFAGHIICEIVEEQLT